MSVEREAEETARREQRPTHDAHLRDAFHLSVDEGKARLHRSRSNLVATGLVGGFDVGLGVLALLVVEEATGSRMLGALAFTIGFLALSLGKSELFTENFLLPVAAVVAKRAKARTLARLWIGTAVTNLAAGYVLAWIIVFALPRTHDTAILVASFYATLGSAEAFMLGIIAGMVITLMTWMEHGATSEGGKIVSVVSAAFLLAAVPLNHIIVVSIVLFTGISAGAPFGYLEWVRVAGIAGVSNLIGGLLLVTGLRLLQVGPREIVKERERPPGAPRDEPPAAR